MAAQPNVLIILLDDVGYGASSVVGGPVHMPTAERLADRGLLFNRFHTTAVCSPTRASLLTGRNPHAANFGSVTNAVSADHGYEGILGDDTATIAQLLKAHGYASGLFGKWHLTPTWETTQLGPFDRWPIGRGFDTFHGFLGGESDHWEPNLYRGTTPVPLPERDDYHFTEDLVQQASDWLRLQHAMKPDQPVLCVLTPGAAHAPLHVAPEWIEKYRGVFDDGWDAWRERILAGQISRGLAPSDTTLTARPDGLPGWDDLGDGEQRLAARLMEAYAGFLEHCDTQLGRVLDTMAELGTLDHTLVWYVIGDNGSSAEGGEAGAVSYFGTMMGMPEDVAGAIERIDTIGGRDSYPQYPAGWAWAMCSPFQWVKTVASHFGGTRNPAVASWPAGIAGRGLRSQFGHVNDIVPTILEVVGIDSPAEFRGVPQRPMDGTSLRYAFDDPEAPERHTTQYFEFFGHRSIYHEGWIASARHGTNPPWRPARRFQRVMPFDDDTWELYDTRADFSQAFDLADRHPEKVGELQDLFLAEIIGAGVAEPKDMRVDRTPMPSLMRDRSEVTFTSPVDGIFETEGPPLAGRHWLIEAELTVPETGAHGVLFSVGSRHCGLVLWLDEEGRARFDYRVFDVARVSLATSEPLTAGAHQLTVTFTADQPGTIGSPGQVALVVDGEACGSGHLAQTQPVFFSLDEPFTVGRTSGSPVAGAHPQHYPLNCRFDRVHISWTGGS